MTIRTSPIRAADIVAAITRYRDAFNAPNVQARFDAAVALLPTLTAALGYALNKIKHGHLWWTFHYLPWLISYREAFVFARTVGHSVAVSAKQCDAMAAAFLRDRESGTALDWIDRGMKAKPSLEEQEHLLQRKLEVYAFRNTHVPAIEERLRDVRFQRALES